MGRRTLASLVSAALIAAGLIGISASPALAATNACTQSAGVDMVQNVSYSADGTDGGMQQLTMLNKQAVTANGTTTYTYNIGNFILGVSCAGSLYTMIQVYGGAATPPAGSKISLLLADIVRPLAIGATAADVGTMAQGNMTQLWGKAVVDKSTANANPSWLFYVATDAQAQNTDWMGGTCGAAMLAATATEAPIPTLTEYDDATVTVLAMSGKLQMEVSGVVGESANVAVTVPEFYLNSAACGWNLGITTATSNADVKAKVQAVFGASSVDFTVTSDSTNKTRTFTANPVTLRSKNVRAGTPTELMFSPKAAPEPKPDNGGGGSTTKPAQKATATPSIPAKVKVGKKMVVLRSAVTTDAGQTADVSVTCSKKLKPCKVKEAKSGKVTVSTKKKAKGTITVLLTAPATSTYDAYSFTKVIKVKK